MLKRKLYISAIGLLLLTFWASGALAELIADTVWLRRYSVTEGSWEWARALALDQDGNLYVTGSTSGTGTAPDYCTAKYDSSGVELWVHTYNGPGDSTDVPWGGMAIDNSGNICVTGKVCWDYWEFHCDYAAVKYLPNGDTAWTRTYNGPGDSTDIAYAVAADVLGNFYVTGSSIGSGTSSDYATVKYGPFGDELWVRRYNGPSNSDDKAYGAAVDGEGNVLVTGRSWGEGTQFDFATIKYYASGDTAWIRRYDSPQNSSDLASCIETDQAGNVYVTGSSYVGGINFDYTTVKYDTDGNELWARSYDGPASGEDVATGMTVDDSGNVYVTGASGQDSLSSENLDFVTVKYDPDGVEVWVRRYGGRTNLTDSPSAIAVDSAGNVYVTGQSQRSSQNSDYLTVKYNKEGERIWVARYNGPGDSTDRAEDLAVDASGNVYVTGHSWGAGTGNDYATIRYAQTEILRGDANVDRSIDLADVVYLLNYLFKGDDPPDPLEAGDANCDGIVDLADVVYVLNYLFKGGPEPSC